MRRGELSRQGHSYRSLRTRTSSGYATPEKTAKIAKNAEQSLSALSAFLRGFFLNADGLEMLPGFLLDVLVQAVPVRVHRHDRREVFHFELPHRLRRAELEQRDAIHFPDRARVELRRAADGVQVDGAMFLQCGQRLRAHAAFADHGTHAV